MGRRIKSGDDKKLVGGADYFPSPPAGERSEHLWCEG